MATLDELRQSLITPLPEEQQNIESKATAKDIIHALHSDLIRERQRGVTWQVLSNRLKSKGVDIKPKTLARYVGEINTQQRQKLKPRSRNQATADNSQGQDNVLDGSQTIDNNSHDSGDGLDHSLTFNEIVNLNSEQHTVDVSAQAIDG